MASINALQAAKKVSEAVRKGKKVFIGEILREVGYSDQTSKSPQRVTETKTYKKAMGNIIDGIAEEIERIKKAMSRKDLDAERYRDLSEVMDKLIKNQQLLSGGDTERQSLRIEISETIAKKNNLE